MKERISGADLNWRVIEQIRADGTVPPQVTIAVVPDDKLGWRVIIGKGSRRLVKPERARRIWAIQSELRSKYDLADD